MKKYTRREAYKYTRDYRRSHLTTGHDYSYKPWIDGLTEDLYEVLKQQPSSIINLFSFAQAPGGSNLWFSVYYSNKLSKEAEELLLSWLIRETTANDVEEVGWV